MLNNSKTTISFSAIIIALTFTSLTNCASRQTHDRSRSLDTQTLDSSQIKSLVDNYYKGKETFQKFCIGCHVQPERHINDQYIFDNLFDRLPTPPEDYFNKFIQNSKLLKSTGDKYAQELAKTWGSSYEHVFQDSLSTQDIANLITYIKVVVKQKYHNEQTGGR